MSKADILEHLYPLQGTAMSVYNRALRLHPCSQLVRLKYALAVAKRGYVDVAIRHVCAAQADVDKRKGPVDGAEGVLIQELGAMIMIEASAPMKASAVIDHLLESKQCMRHASLLTARGIIHQQNKDLSTAHADFKRAVHADPSDPEAHYNLGCLLMEYTDWRGAYGALTKTLALRPKHTLALLNRGVSLYQMHRAQEAHVDFNNALALQPDFAQALLNRGVMHQVAGRYGEAEADLTRALELLNGSKEALQCRSLFYQAIGSRDLSLRDNAHLIALTDRD